MSELEITKYDTTVFTVELCNAPKRKGIPYTYKQYVIGNNLYLEHTTTGTISVAYLDPGVAKELGDKHNFFLDTGCRFTTEFCGVTFRIHELVLDQKSNKNLVVNHLDGNPANNKKENLEVVTNWFNIALKKTTNNLPLGISHNHKSYRVKFLLPPCLKSHVLTFVSSNINYLQNVHYKIATEAGLVDSTRYLQSDIQGFVPDPDFQPLQKHLASIELLILSHAENQHHWQVEGKKAPLYPDDYIELLIEPTRIRNRK